MMNLASLLEFIILLEIFEQRPIEQLNEISIDMIDIQYRPKVC